MIISFQKLHGKFTLLLTSILTSICSIAQETKKVDININTKSDMSNFFMQPWVWVVGSAVFILLLVIILRSGKSK